MRLNFNFREIDEKLNVKFQEIHQVSDGGYDKGYNDGYDKGYGIGNTEGYENGYSKGEQVGYDKGYEVGYGESYDNGFDKGFIDGKQAEYDKFWDSFQDYGNRTKYSYSFYQSPNLKDWFYPKYDIKPTFATGFMRDATMSNDDDETIDLVERLKECNITMDFSNCTNVTYLFYQTRVSHLPEINVTKAGTSGNDLLFGGYVETIDKFIFDKSQTLSNSFGYCNSLKNIIFEGVYEAGGLRMHWSTLLDKESLTSIINCLSATTSGLAVTLSLQAVNKAFETSEGANDGSNSAEWTTLVATKTNWTVNLS